MPDEPETPPTSPRTDPLAPHELPIDPDRAPAGSGRRADPLVLAAIAVGGALGAPARYGLTRSVHIAPGSFPWATFGINVTGSFALGLVLALLLERFPPARYLRPFVATGVLGGFTTYSTFAVETDLLVRDGHAAIGVVYAAASLLAGFVAVGAGIRSARALPVRPGSRRA